MGTQPEHETERGSSEEAAQAPLTETERETSQRPAGVTPGVTPGFEEEEEVTDAEFKRRKELNPDDFE